MGATRAHGSIVRFMNVIVLALIAGLIAGCAGGGVQNFFGGASGPSQPVTIAKMIGPPSKVEKDLKAELGAAGRSRNVTIVPSGGTYTVRGYLSTSPDGNNYKVAYIWDVLDKSGKRAHRILGEQAIPKRGSDPWAGVNKQALTAIATKTMTDLARWLPKQSGPARSTAQPVASATQRRGFFSSNRPAAKMAIVPSVRGAPGDGSTSLTAAMKQQLTRKGIKVATSKGENVYTVSGLVKMGRPRGNSQTIDIVWQVIDPQGKKLRKVSQSNTIAKGSLNGPWGASADKAAGAAADAVAGIIRAGR